MPGTSELMVTAQKIASASCGIAGLKMYTFVACYYEVFLNSYYQIFD